jgi:hypothetical protein
MAFMEPGVWHVVIPSEGAPALAVRCGCGQLLRSKVKGKVGHCGTQHQAPDSFDGLPVRVSIRVSESLKFRRENHIGITERKWRERMQALNNEQEIRQ